MQDSEYDVVKRIAVCYPGDEQAIQYFVRIQGIEYPCFFHQGQMVADTHLGRFWTIFG